MRLGRQGKSRDELRGDFEAELARRELPQDPIWVERKLDELEQSPAEGARKKAQNLLLAGSALGRLARSRGVPEPPAWMTPPADASYHGPPRRGDKVPVELDRDATALLDRALASAPGHVGDLHALAPVWFDWSAGGEEGGQVEVYLGHTRVGVLDRRSSESFAPVMRAAAEQDCKPQGTSQLARAEHLDPPYLLVIDLPAR